ncbi:MAG: mycofactocin biosynthesis glycosyltransferase MftF [Actinomycetota bacterium]|jgi:mycofactocin glycosyltransferase
MASFNGGVLPDGFRVVLDPGARWIGDGTVLVGGSPIRLLRMTAPGRQLVDRLAAGEPVPRSPAAQSLARRLLDAGLAHPRPPAPDRGSGAEVAAVVPVRNDPEGLGATLGALSADGAFVSVVVVDDASDDPVAVKARCTAPGVTLLQRGTRGGPAAARNDGWRTATAPFVAFIDANCEPQAGWLDALLPHFADPQVAAVAPRIVSPAGDGAAQRGMMAAYEAVASPLDLGDRESIVRPRSPVAYVPTAALVVRRSALKALGGFDESLTVGEDVDFIWRLVAAGWTVRYDPRALVRHPIRPSWRAWLTQRYRYGTSAAALARRHGWAVAPAVVSPWTAGAWTLAAVGQPLLAVAAGAGSTVALTRTVPAREAARLAGLGHLRGGLALARALRRAWWPAAVALAVKSRRTRPALAAAVVVPGALEWLQRRPRLDPIRFVGLRLIDDVAYAAGVWAGCARERSGKALLPDFRSARSRCGGPN